MFAMQYQFVLPADYDMAIIHRRVREKGHFLDHHAPLLFKAYLGAQRLDPRTRSTDNRYAPFYLWRDAAGAQEFLLSNGFQGVVAAFGRPAVETWPLMLAVVQGGMANAAFAVRASRSLPVGIDLARLAAEERVWASERVHGQGDAVALSACDPTGWGLVRFCLRPEPPLATESRGEEVQVYDLLHLSLPGATIADQRGGGA